MRCCTVVAAPPGVPKGSIEGVDWPARELYTVKRGLVDMVAGALVRLDLPREGESRAAPGSRPSTAARPH